MVMVAVMFVTLMTMMMVCATLAEKWLRRFLPLCTDSVIADSCEGEIMSTRIRENQSDADNDGVGMFARIRLTTTVTASQTATITAQI